MQVEEKNMKKPERKIPVRPLYLLVLILFCAGSWAWLFYDRQQEEAVYADRKQQAYVMYRKKIYDEALDDCTACLKTHPEDTDILLLAARTCYMTGKYGSTNTYCSKLLQIKPSESAMLLKAKAYEKDGKTEKAAEEMEDMPASKEAAALLLKLKGKYTITYLALQYTSRWFEGPSGGQLAYGVENDLVSLYTAKGKKYLRGNFTWLGQPSPDGALTPAVTDGQFCFVDRDGNRRLVPDETFVSLGRMADGYAPAQQDGTWGYIDEALKKTHFEYSKAYPFVNGRALVQKDGRWLIINTTFETCAELDCETVSEDEYQSAVHGDVIIGRAGGKARIYDLSGNRLSDFGADNIRVPEEKGGVIAFLQGNAWGFATQQGKVLIEPKYEDAHSFSQGYAAIKENGKWGYIDKQGNLLIPCTFDDVCAFSASGTAWVKNSAGWNLLKLARYS